MTGLDTDYKRFIHLSRYARWLDTEGRRETWEETVRRYCDWMACHIGMIDDKLWDEIEQAIINTEVLPSMRALMTAGPALERSHVAGYNCAYLPVDSPRSFDESMFILLCGTGVGYSVERQYTDRLPIVQVVNSPTERTIVVADSKEGWATALRSLVSDLYKGNRPKWDTSGIRPAGARLRTFGGRASGPGPLEELFVFVSEIFARAAGRRLSSLECHDIMCKIADVVVVGGVRRSAMISLSDLNDSSLRDAKHGAWWENEPQRGLSNNSAVYLGKPSIGDFLREWQSLYDSKSGERGIFNREASLRQAARNGRRDLSYDFGTNPCSEIILRPYQFCNLTEVVVRAGDSVRDLERKVRLAAILGTFQSTLTNLRYLRPIWRTNTESERLLGVSLTGILDHGTLPYDSGLQERLKSVAVQTNKEFAERLGISASVAITCVKPSGTVSQLVDSASGIHPRHSEFYIRTVRGDKKDPITQFMIDQGVPNEPDVTKPDDTVVFSFPQRAPDGALTRHQLGALDHLEVWARNQAHWCEHKPSVTINVKEDEWMDVGAWVFRNFDIISGVSFLPFSEHTYRQAPYQECNEQTYNEMVARMPFSIDWSLLSDYEKTDMTTGSQEYACASGFCEIV